jgi:hypothetical protein
VKIIRRAERINETEYWLVFDFKGAKNWGYSFQCDEYGAVDREALPPEGLANLIACENGEHDVELPRIQEYEVAANIPGLGECDACGTVVMLIGFTNTCDKCGADYNLSGQRLAPRQQWGEETGEHWTDIIRPYAPGEEWDD